MAFVTGCPPFGDSPRCRSSPGSRPTAFPAPQAGFAGPPPMVPDEFKFETFVEAQGTAMQEYLSGVVAKLSKTDKAMLPKMSVPRPVVWVSVPFRVTRNSLVKLSKDSSIAKPRYWPRGTGSGLLGGGHRRNCPVLR